MRGSVRQTCWEKEIKTDGWSERETGMLRERDIKIEGKSETEGASGRETKTC